MDLSKILQAVKFHSGFRTGHNTIPAATIVRNEAFDSVEHNMLPLDKLRTAGISPKAIKWFKNYCIGHTIIIGQPWLRW